MVREAPSAIVGGGDAHGACHLLAGETLVHGEVSLTVELGPLADQMIGLYATQRHTAVFGQHLHVRKDCPAPHREPLAEGGARCVAYGQPQGDAVDDVAALEADVRETGVAERVRRNGAGVEQIVCTPAVNYGRLVLPETQVAHLYVGVELMGLDEVRGRGRAAALCVLDVARHCYS